MGQSTFEYIVVYENNTAKTIYKRPDDFFFDCYYEADMRKAEITAIIRNGCHFSEKHNIDTSSDTITENDRVFKYSIFRDPKCLEFSNDKMVESFIGNSNEMFQQLQDSISVEYIIALFREPHSPDCKP